MSTYDTKPERFLEEFDFEKELPVPSHVFCAGFELGTWRCVPYAKHLVEWLPDYALTEDELEFHHGNAYAKLQEAAVRVYKTLDHAKRGEVGEISLHAICRDFFGTTPISPRVFYKSTSNDVVKAFDMVHARFTDELEVWLGESKFYADPGDAVRAAIASITEHLDAGFLESQKLLLGPQIPKGIPNYEQIRGLFKSQTSIDDLIKSAIFVVGIFCENKSAKEAAEKTEEYVEAATKEVAGLRDRLLKSNLHDRIRMLLIYVPLANKNELADAFDAKLKGLQ
jgi:hypothetical protein